MISINATLVIQIIHFLILVYILKPPHVPAHFETYG